MLFDLLVCLNKYISESGICLCCEVDCYIE